MKKMLILWVAIAVIAAFVVPSCVPAAGRCWTTSTTGFSKAPLPWIIVAMTASRDKGQAQLMILKSLADGTFFFTDANTSVEILADMEGLLRVKLPDGRILYTIRPLLKCEGD